MPTLKLNKTCIILALVLSFVGCGTGDGLNRQTVSGEVTWDGAPLEQGIIRFEPIQSEHAVVAEREIVNGTYSIAKKNGLVPGEYRVLIFSPEKLKAGDASPDAMPGGSEIPQAKERIPARYNVATTLKAMVTDSGENQINFPLVSKEK